jgi:hypothetical protein
MIKKIFNLIKKAILPIAICSIYIFLFQFLGAEEGFDVYLGICGTVITIFLYAKHNKV